MFVMSNCDRNVNDMYLISSQECAVVPDVHLHEKLQALSYPQASSLSHDATELSHILDFFFALAVCNTVVVSSPSQPRHMVHATQQNLCIVLF